MKDENLCKELLERLLKIKIERLSYPETEKKLIPQYESEGIRLNLYVKDSDGNGERIFDVEIQTYRDQGIEKRVRFYQSVLDMDNLQHGMIYKDLPESYIIFICTQDPFNLDLPVYETKTVFKNTDTMYNDDTHRIFFNAAAYEKVKDEKVKNFLRFVCTHSASDEFTSKIDEASLLAKQNVRWRKEYIFFYDVLEEEKRRVREIVSKEAREEGLAEGRADARAKLIKMAGANMMEVSQEEKEWAYHLSYDRAEIDYNNGLKLAEMKGAHDKAVESARNLYANGISIEIIAKSLNMTQEQVSEIVENKN